MQLFPTVLHSLYVRCGKYCKCSKQGRCKYFDGSTCFMYSLTKQITLVVRFRIVKHDMQSLLKPIQYDTPLLKPN
jgi:hypothetical protein